MQTFCVQIPNMESFDAQALAQNTAEIRYIHIL